MKKTTEDQVVKWYEDGLTIDEFSPLIPQYNRLEIEAVIKRYKEKKRWERLMAGSRS